MQQPQPTVWAAVTVPWQLGSQQQLLGARRRRQPPPQQWQWQWQQQQPLHACEAASVQWLVAAADAAGAAAGPKPPRRARVVFASVSASGGPPWGSGAWGWSLPHQQQPAQTDAKQPHPPAAGHAAGQGLPQPPAGWGGKPAAGTNSGGSGAGSNAVTPHSGTSSSPSSGSGSGPATGRGSGVSEPRPFHQPQQPRLAAPPLSPASATAAAAAAEQHAGMRLLSRHVSAEASKLAGMAVGAVAVVGSHLLLNLSNLHRATDAGGAHAAPWLGLRLPWQHGRGDGGAAGADGHHGSGAGAAARAAFEPAEAARRWLGRGQAAEKALDLREALSCYQSAVALQPGDLECVCRLAKVMSDLTYEPGASNEQVVEVNAKAVEYAERGVALAPKVGGAAGGSRGRGLAGAQQRGWRGRNWGTVAGLWGVRQWLSNTPWPAAARSSAEGPPVPMLTHPCARLPPPRRAGRRRLHGAVRQPRPPCAGLRQQDQGAPRQGGARGGGDGARAGALERPGAPPHGQVRRSGTGKEHGVQLVP
jgi:hypothetical protein